MKTLNVAVHAVTYVMQVTDIDGRHLIYHPRPLHNKNSFGGPRLRASAEAMVV